MNIDDLEKDIAEMEEDEPGILTEGISKNTEEYLDMCEIAAEYYEDRDKCKKLQDLFWVNHKYKINIV